MGLIRIPPEARTSSVVAMLKQLRMMGFEPYLDMDGPVRYIVYGI
jgi:hypothetical protein